jgi:hypothetical protein
MAEKSYVVAVTGISGENGLAFEEGQVVTETDLGATFARHQRLGSLREASEGDQDAWKRKLIERGELQPDAAPEVTTGNSTQRDPAGAARVNADQGKGSVNPTDQNENLDELTVPELRERAQALQISPVPTLKGELISAINQARVNAK